MSVIGCVNYKGYLIRFYINNMKNLSPQKTILLTVIPAIVATVLLVGGAYLWLDYQDDQRETQLVEGSEIKEKADVETNIDDWRVMPHFSKNLNFYFYYPENWNVTSSYSSGSIDQEGNIIWLSSGYEYDTSEAGFDYSIGTFFDTGDDLKTWVNKKKNEIEKARGVPVEIAEREVNGQEALELCSNGYIAEYPEPACFVYLHSAPFILELKIGRYNTSDFEGVVSMTHALQEKFYLIESSTENLALYESYNLGYRIDYDSEEMSIDQYGNQCNETFGSIDSTSMQIVVTTGAVSDLEKYWYDYEVSSSDNTTITRPHELYLDGVRCIYSFDAKSDYLPDAECKVIFCIANDKLYRITLYPDKNDDLAYDKLFGMLSTLQFATENAITSERYIFRDDNGHYSLVYPAAYGLWEEGGNEQRYFTFAEQTNSWPVKRSVSISYQVFDGTLEECVTTETCLLFYQTLTGHSVTVFKGITALERIYDHGEGVIMREIVFKRGNIIYNLSISTATEGANSEIDEVVDSLEFL